MKRTAFALLSLLIVLSMLLAACGATPEPTKAPEPTEAAPKATEAAVEPTAEPPAVEEPSGDKVQVRWFVGLGTGANPDQIPQEDEVVARFNETHDNIELVVEYVTNDQAPDQLKTQIAAGNAPDIIGPVGQSGVNEFEGTFMDLTEYIESTGYDLGVYDPGSVDFYRVADGMYGIPFAVFPSFIFYNRDLFDEAGLEYPPQKYGEPYADGDPWTVEKLEEIAMLLTVDVEGNDATMEGFDPDNIAQFGYVTQWNNDDIRSQCAALFGAGTLVDDDGNAVISDQWRDCVQWYYEGMHEKHFVPDLTYDQSDLLGAGNPFDSGNVAMAHSHLWYICCNSGVENWDIAAVPAWNEDGDVTSKLHADTFRIFDSTEHPEEAFEVLAWLTNEGSADLTQIYGALPARLDQQDAFFDGLDERFPQGVDWQVVVDSLPYPDVPGHEWNMPNYSQAVDRLQAFGTLYAAEAGLDLNAEIDQLIADLQIIFEGGEWTPPEVPEEEPPAAELTCDEPVQVRWFVGLGTGANPDQIPQEDEVVARFNESQDCIELVVEYVTNDQAPDQLKTQIAAGNAPDIIGPVGQSGVNEFEGTFMDLTEYIESTGYDLGVYDPGSVDFYRVADGMYGIPFAVFPSFIFYNRDLFDEAGLEYPPHEYGEPYADGDPWTVEKLEEIAMLLTVDVNGNDATMEGFDPDNIAQFGYVTQWNNDDIRSQCAALFGAGTLVDDDGNAVISDQWRDCVQWYYEGMHEKHFMPDLTYDQSDLLGAGNPFDSGNVAMAHSHLWYICCNSGVENWDIAAVPAWNEDGDVTSKLHADTFRIFDSTEYPEEAFYVLAWLTNEGSADLTQIYGALPARLDQQDAFFDGLDERFPQGVDWQVVVDSLPYPDVPGHEWNMPNYSQAVDRLQAFGTLYAAEAGLDLNAEIDQLIADLQVIFSEAE